jgi:AcrR family transcriptional regulator
MPKDTWTNLPESKRARILEVAMREFGARGFSAGSLNVIAREAGIAKGSLFQYFDDKLDFFATVSEMATSGIQESVLVGIDLERDAYFDALRALVRNWLQFFRANPVQRAMAVAAANELDADARAAVQTVTNQHYLDVFLPLAKRAESRGELLKGVDVDQLIAMTVMLLRHLDSAPFNPHIDPILGLAEKPPAGVERIALELVEALQRAFGNPKRR